MKTQLRFAAAVLGLLICSGVYAQTLPEAKRYTESEQYDKAKSTFRQLVAKEPTNGDNFYYFGNLMMVVDDADSAKKLYDQGVAINATNPLVHIGLARYYFMTGNPAEGQKEIAYAKSLLTTQAGPKGTNIPVARQQEIYLEMAKVYIDATPGDAQAALDLTNAAENLDKKNPTAEIYLVRGDAQLKKDPVVATPAIEYYNKAAALDPKSAKAYVRIGRVYAAGKNMVSAISFFNKALAIEPNFAPAYEYRGEAYYQIGKFDSAAVSYAKYLSINPDCYSRYRYTAFLYKSGDYENAIKQGDLVLACDSSITVVYRIIGRCYLEMKNPDANKAIVYFDKFFEKQKQYGKPKLIADDYIYRGRALSKNNKDSLAVIDYEKGLAVDTSRNDIYFDVATAYFKMKKYDKAGIYYKKKIDVNPAKATISDWNAYGRALYSQKDYVNADSAFKKVTEIDPKNPIGWFWRGRANAQQDPDGKKGQARPYYESYLDLAMADSLNKEKNKKDMISAATYLASYHFVVLKNYSCAKAYYLFIASLDANNEAAKTALEQDKNIKAATAAEMATCKLPASGTK